MIQHTQKAAACNSDLHKTHSTGGNFTTISPQRKGFARNLEEALRLAWSRPMIVPARALNNLGPVVPICWALRPWLVR